MVVWAEKISQQEIWCPIRWFNSTTIRLDGHEIGIRSRNDSGDKPFETDNNNNTNSKETRFSMCCNNVSSYDFQMVISYQIT